MSAHISSDHSIQSRIGKYLFYILLVLFLLSGTISHDPWWKRGEAYGFGIIHHFYLTGTWLVPIDAGTPFLEKPPLYYWTCVIFIYLFKSILPLHDAARLATTFYTIITLLFTYWTGKQLFRDHENSTALARMNVAFLIGAQGIMHFSHALLTDTALLSGTAITLYGGVILATEPTCWKKSGLWIGIGLGVAFMSKGFVMPGILGISGILLCALLPNLRARTTLKALAVALLAASPFLLIWPALLTVNPTTYSCSGSGLITLAAFWGLLLNI